MLIDAKGKSCPMPVILAKKEIEGGSNAFSIEVDNSIAVQNLEKLASSKGFDCSYSSRKQGGYAFDAGEIFTVNFVKNREDEIESSGGETQSWAVFAGRAVIGDGARELGESLIKMYFYTLSQGDNIPSFVLLMNDGVRLACENEQVIEHLKALESMGTKTLVCGACLNFYGLADKLQAGQVSNMYDITEAMGSCAKVISL